MFSGAVVKSHHVVLARIKILLGIMPGIKDMLPHPQFVCMYMYIGVSLVGMTKFPGSECLAECLT